MFNRKRIQELEEDLFSLKYSFILLISNLPERPFKYEIGYSFRYYNGCHVEHGCVENVEIIARRYSDDKYSNEYLIQTGLNTFEWVLEKNIK